MLVSCRVFYKSNEKLDCKLQSISASIEAVCRKTLQKVNRDSEANPCPKISVKNYMSYQIGARCIANRSTEVKAIGLPSKGTPTEVSNLRLLTLPFANSNQFQTLSLSNSWRFECLLSDKNSRPNCILSPALLETSARR